MNKRAELLCSHSSVEELYSLLDTMEKEAEEVGSRDLKSVVMLNAVETALRYLLVRRADYALRAISNFIHFDPFDTRDPLWVSLDFFQNSNTAQKVTVLDRIKLKLALTAAVYCICKRDVETAHKHLQRLSECLSIIKSRVYQLFYRDDYKISPNIFNELLKISAVICLLSGVCSRERDTQESNFYFYRCLEITKQAKESIRQMDIRSYSMHKIEDLAVWLSTFDFTVRRHIMASYIASSDGVSALNSLQAINSDPRVSRCSARFFRRLNLNMAQVYKSLGLDLAALHHFGLSISNNDPESSFIAYSSISSIYILNPTLERSNMVRV